MSCQTYAGLKSKFPVQYGPSHSAAGLFDGLLQTDQAVQAFRSCSCMPLENRHEKDVGDSLCSNLWCPASPDTCGKAPCTRVDSFGTLLPPQPISPPRPASLQRGPADGLRGQVPKAASRPCSNVNGPACDARAPHAAYRSRGGRLRGDTTWSRVRK